MSRQHPIVIGNGDLTGENLENEFLKILEELINFPQFFFINL
jgi:hypothetical protein